MARLACMFTFLDYKKGAFLVASVPKASELNERNSFGLIGPRGIKVLTRQIAGIIAQRIVCELKLDRQVDKGARVGMIKFGSRTEVYLPKNRVERIDIK